MADRISGVWVVILSLFIALVLGVLSLPDSFPNWLAYARPNWIGLVVFYWIISLPQRYGLVLAWVCGLILDVLQGGLLGQHAIGFVVLALIASNLYQRMRMFSIWQQAMIVFVGMLGVQLLVYVIDYIALDKRWQIMDLLSVLVSALMWPWVFLCLRYARRRFGVS